MGKEQETESGGRRHGGRYIYEELRRQILTLKLKPGVQLDEVSLAAQFGLSRSPVRDALARLVTEGLVTILPNRTTLVTPFEIEEFPNYIAALDLIQRAVTTPGGQPAQGGRPGEHPSGRRRLHGSGRQRRFPGHVGTEQGVPHECRRGRPQPIFHQLLRAPAGRRPAPAAPAFRPSSARPARSSWAATTTRSSKPSPHATPTPRKRPPTSTPCCSSGASSTTCSRTSRPGCR